MMEDKPIYFIMSVSYIAKKTGLHWDFTSSVNISCVFVHFHDHTISGLLCNHPNHFFAGGHNASVSGGTFFPVLDTSVDWADIHDIIQKRILINKELDHHNNEVYNPNQQHDQSYNICKNITVSITLPSEF